MRIEQHNLHGTGDRDHEVYEMAAVINSYWDAVTQVSCPVESCTQMVLWYEAGYVPGYRVCMADGNQPGLYDPATLQHRFLAKGSLARPTLVRDDCCED